MQKRKIRTIKAVCLMTAALLAAAPLSGCGLFNPPQQQNAVTQSALSEEELLAQISYKVEQITIPAGVEPLNGVLYSNGIYYCAYDRGNSTASSVYLIAFTAEKTVFDKAVVTDGELSAFKMNEKGEPVVLVKVPGENGQSEYSTISFNTDGEVTSQTTLQNAYTFDDEVSGKYIGSMLIDKDGNIYLTMGDLSVRMFDKTGKNLGDIVPDDAGAFGFNNGIFLTGDGRPATVITLYTDSDIVGKLLIIDPENRKFSASYELPEGDAYGVPAGSEYLCYYTSDTGIKGCKTDLTWEPVLNLVSLGVDSSIIRSFTSNDDGSFSAISMDLFSSNYTLSHITPIDPKDVKPKQNITLGCLSLDWHMRSLIADYNKQSDSYRIVVNSYADTTGTSLVSSDAINAAASAYNSALLSGSVPDILQFSDGLNMQTYAAKGLFDDLYPYLDKDPDISKDDFFTNILALDEYKGQLIKIGPQFSITAFMGYRSLLGDSHFLTNEGAQAIINGMPEGAKLIHTCDRESALKYSLLFSDLVDKDAGTCSFDSNNFRKILEETAKFPETIDYNALQMEDPNYYDTQRLELRKGMCLLSEFFPFNPSMISDAIQQYFAGDVNFVNFPVPEPKGYAVADLSGSLAISKKASNKDGAWDFIKYTLTHNLTSKASGYYDKDGNYVETDDIRYTFGGFGFPLLKKDFITLMDQAKLPEYEYDENGTPKEMNHTYNLSGTEIKITPLSDSDYDMIMQLVNDINLSTDDLDPKITEIVNDEVKLYYTGDKTAADVSSAIQSRVSIYLSEQS